VTPEFVAKLGAAYGAMLGAGAYVITSRDSHKVSRLLKRSLISGLMSTGVRVGDLRTVPVPVVRYEMGKEGESGGVHVRLSPFDSRQVDIRVFDKDGNDLSVSKEKAIEQLFMREDFKRAAAGDVGELSVPPRVQEYYKTGFLKNINIQTLHHRKFKVVIDYSFSPACMILPELLGEMGIDSVSLNAHTSTTKVTRTGAEFSQALQELSHIVGTLKADAGFLIDNGAEKLFMVDETGRVIPSEETLVLVGLLALQSANQAVIAYPVRGTSVLEQLATIKGSTVLRTPINPRYILEYARRPNVGFVGDAEGGFIFPRFQPAFDAMYSIAKILELLAEHNTSLAKFWSQIRAQIFVLHRRVPCPWSRKGQVMRLAQINGAGLKIELLDGVKLHLPEGWALVLPDGNEAFCHVWVEGKTEKAARQILDEYTRKVEEWQKVQDAPDVVPPAVIADETESGTER
jgi:mannose-1-phosphate guanylyltransferase / phosphomannomutase